MFEVTTFFLKKGFVSLLDQQLEELKNCTGDGATTAAAVSAFGDGGPADGEAPKKKKKKKKKKIMFENGFGTSVTAEDEAEAGREDREKAEAAVQPYGQWETVQAP